jgi:hypothetical protein
MEQCNKQAHKQHFQTSLCQHRLCLWYMPCQVLLLLLELWFVLPKEMLDFFLFIYKFFLFMTDVIGREECSTAHWIDTCKIDEAGKIANNFVTAVKWTIFYILVLQ